MYQLVTAQNSEFTTSLVELVYHYLFLVEDIQADTFK